MRFSINMDCAGFSPEKSAYLAKKAGFDSMFVWHSRTDGLNESRINAVRREGLTVETAHTDFWGINNIWLDSEEGKIHFDYYLNAIEFASKHQVPTLIIHLSSGNNPPPVNELGLSRYHKMIESAEKNGVVLAFENLRKTAYLDAILQSTDSKNAKFCFDIGHENIYNGGFGVLEKHGDRLAAFHIHDNTSKNDDHFLPFDGTINWENAAKRIIPYLQKLPLTIEAYSAEKYDPETFYDLAMARAKKIIKSY